MSDDDLIRRGDVLAEIQRYGVIGQTAAIRAIPEDAEVARLRAEVARLTAERDKALQREDAERRVKNVNLRRWTETAHQATKNIVRAEAAEAKVAQLMNELARCEKYLQGTNPFHMAGGIKNMDQRKRNADLLAALEATK